jgi:hypothetical protein
MCPKLLLAAKVLVVAAVQLQKHRDDTYSKEEKSLNFHVWGILQVTDCCCAIGAAENPAAGVPIFLKIFLSLEPFGTHSNLSCIK